MRFFITLSIIAFLLPFPDSASAQPVFQVSGRPLLKDPNMGALAPSPTRTVMDLNGRWEYHSENNLLDTDVLVPSSFSGDEKVTFSRTFEVEKGLVDRSVFQLVALSISYYCEIKINDRFVGKHAGATSFSIKLPPEVIRPGRNKIEIVVHPTLNAQETLPLTEKLWNKKHFGGILYDIALIANGVVWVQESSVRTNISGEAKAATVQYRALLNSGSPSKLRKDSSSISVLGKFAVEHSIEIIDDQSGQTVVRSEAQRVETEPDRLVPVAIDVIIPSARMWSPESPSLYTIVERTTRNGALVAESYVHLGLRDYSVKGSALMLNGQKYFLKGLTYTEYSPIHGRSLTFDEIERDVLIMKNLGINTVRLTDGVVHPYFLTLCDRYGLLVFQDLPAFGVPSSLLKRPSLQATAGNMLQEMISRDGTHPCIVAYGLAQYIDGAASGYNAYVEAVLEATKGRENKLAYASFCTPPKEAWPASLDFACVDILPSSVESVRKLLERLSVENEKIPVLISSVMFPVEVGNYNGYSDHRSIDAQAHFFHETYSQIWNLKFAGIIVHSFSDWGVSIPIMTVDRVQQFTATAGVVDLYRQKRLSYDVLKARFNNEKPPVLMVGNFSPEHPASFVIIGLLIIFVFAVMYNLFRRFRENVVRSFLRPFNFYSDVRDQRMLSIFQTSVIGFVGSLSAALLVGNIMYFLRTDYTFDFLISLIVHSVWLKKWINYACWNPLANIAVLTLVFFGALLVFSLLLRIVAFFFKRQILLFDTYSVSMWAVLPVIMLAPFGLILYRLLEIPFLEILAIVIVGVFHVWVLTRLLKGSAIVLDVRPLFFYAGGFGILFFAVGWWMIAADSRHETFSYLRYIADVWYFLRAFS